MYRNDFYWPRLVLLNICMALCLSGITLRAQDSAQVHLKDWLPFSVSDSTAVPPDQTGRHDKSAQKDTQTVRMDEVNIRADREQNFGISRLRPVEGVMIYAGKKTEVLELDNLTVNTATNNARQVYAKVAGLNIWESDGAGLQLGVGARGLSPNRSSNFNTRQNGYDMSADALGYPESYYTPPVEALDRIEVIRGAASLQYGTQFGGVLNFRFRRGPENRKVAVRSRQTLGSFGFVNSFNSLGGTVGKFDYYTFYQYKGGDGWRPHSAFDSHTAHVSGGFNPHDRLEIRAEYTMMHYLARQPGGLTDVLFEQDPEQSLRSRNWFDVQWNLMGMTLDYRFSSRTRLNVRAFGLIGRRYALGNLQRIDRLDRPDTPRDLLKDTYRNIGTEVRLLHRYKLWKKMAIVSGGIRLYRGHTHRSQGLGNTGSDADFSYPAGRPEYSDFEFPSSNVAAFAEQILYLTHKFSVTPGFRFEYIHTAADGRYSIRNMDRAGNLIYEADVPEQQTRDRSFALLGLGLSWKPRRHLESYANISQNYRGVNFNDLRVVNPNLRVDPNIQDERGFNGDLGVRGNIKSVLNYDVSAFVMMYRDRIGSIFRKEPGPEQIAYLTYRYRTNVADSRTFGLETFVELGILRLMGITTKSKLTLFNNLTVLDARYINTEEPAIADNLVELVPNLIWKSGVTFERGPFRMAVMNTYVSEHYTDATNAERTPTAVDGLIPAYFVLDFSASYRWKWFTLEASVNNFTDEQYFTRRASGYPGPGIIPAEPRSFFLTLQFSLPEGQP